MIKKDEDIRRFTCDDMTITEVIRRALADNLVRIPYANEGGFIATELSEDGTDDTQLIHITGFYAVDGLMMQQVTVIYFDTLSRANRFLSSPEGRLFDDEYSNGQDCFDYTTYAGNPLLPFLIATILRNHFGFKESSPLDAYTYCNVDYFRKDPDEIPKQRLKS